MDNSTNLPVLPVIPVGDFLPPVTEISMVTKGKKGRPPKKNKKTGKLINQDLQTRLELLASNSQASSSVTSAGKRNRNTSSSSDGDEPTDSEMNGKISREDLKNLILSMNQNMVNMNQNMQSNFNDLKGKFDNHLKEFSEFKSTITQEITNTKAISNSTVEKVDSITKRHEQLVVAHTALVHSFNASQTNNEANLIMIDKLEQDKLNYCLEIVGIPRKPDEKLHDIMITLTDSMAIPIERNDIKSIKRKGKSLNANILVTMWNDAQAQLIITMARKQRGIKLTALDPSAEPTAIIYINPVLTERRQSFLFNARKANKMITQPNGPQLNFVWIVNGRVVCKPNTLDSRPVEIVVAKDINTLIKTDYVFIPRNH